MTWFKVDDTLGSHPKARAAGLAAMGLWVVAGAWASQHLTEGFIPDWYVKSWPSGQKRAANLVESGLWIEVDSGYRFHQWEERQPTKEHVEAERAAARERQRRHRESKRDAAVSHGVTDGVTNRTPTRPDPSVLPSEELSSAASRRGTRLPEDFTITEEMKAWAVDKGMNGNYVLPRHETFMNHWPAQPGKAGVKLDWVKTWKNWMLRDFKPVANVHPVDFGGNPEDPKPPSDDMRQRWK
jgi:hypothetical protein